MKKAIIFDLDGTLLNTSEGVKNSIRYVADYMNLPQLEDNDLDTFIGPPIYESLKKWYDLDESNVKSATELFRDIYSTKFLFQATVYEDIPEVLSYLKARGYLLGIATNKRYDYVNPLLEKFNLLSYFNEVQGTDFGNTLKKPDVICNCLKNMRIEDGDYACMIGDTLQDYNGATDIGIDFLGVCYGFGFSCESHNNHDIRLVETVNEIKRVFS